ncbi:MAG TPA: ATP synthase F1 subunit delta [Pyrinomonadaceae bacterium]|jgi:F-type H+-transporting ATPase subunit delta|nr:ATP synthase F1 subunit delta [Pyrinomonadaceae bacterium]
MSLQTIARRYASALAEVTVDRNEEAPVQQEINYWADLIANNSQLREVFANPTIPYDQKRRVLEELITRTRIGETSASFLRVLLRNQRLAELKYIAERFGHVLDERHGIIGANVTTARPVPDDVKTALRDALSAKTGRSVRLSFSTDESIIGGVVAQIGSTIFDGSVQGHLDRLAGELMNR